MNQTRIYSAGSNLSGFGGAQKVLIDIHNGIKKEFPDSKILGFQKYKDLNAKYRISSDEYTKIGNPLKLKNAIIIIHARKLTTYFAFIDWLFSLNLRLVYVSHNIYLEKKALTFLPKHIVSISDKVTDNLINYFKVSPERITKIHNGIADTAPIITFAHKSDNEIKILYPARLTSVKRQVQLVQFLKDKLPYNIRISFAGVGPDTEALKAEIGDSKNFEMLGFVDDMDSVLRNCDYVMLFSEKEGLPISLMEGIMYSKPLIVNDVGGNLEIAIGEKNAFIANTLPELASLLKLLPSKDSTVYKEFCKNSREHYEKYFRYETMINQYIQLLNNLIK